MIRTRIACLALALLPVLATAQSNPLSKKLDHANELYKEGKSSKADKYLVDLLEEHPDLGDGWDMLVALRAAEAEQAAKVRIDKGKSKFVVTSKTADGKEIPLKDDTLGKELMEMLNGMDLGKQAEAKYYYTIRQALMHSNDAYNASVRWRISKVDPEVDSNVGRKALKYYENAEQEFVARNFSSAAQMYRRAIEEQPDFFKARLYLGDALYASENYADALVSFNEAIKQFPDLLEPRKYLGDAYMKMKAYDKALDAYVNALCAYPDLSIFGKMDNAAYYLGKKIDIHWSPRGVLPARVQPATKKLDFNTYSEKADDSATGPWIYYSQAAARSKSYCNDQGIISDESALDGNRYLEVYCWQQMLKESTDPSLAEARRMLNAGFLDCYVLVTCFHPDLVGQYRDFAAKNHDKIERYYRDFLASAN